jgi:hypothetical protein
MVHCTINAWSRGLRDNGTLSSLNLSDNDLGGYYLALDNGQVGGYSSDMSGAIDRLLSRYY